MDDDTMESVSLAPIIKTVDETIESLRQAGRDELANDVPDEQRLLEIRRGILCLEGTLMQLKGLCLSIDAVKTQYIDT